MLVATCISGSAPRSLGLGCVGNTIFERLILPLNSDIFVSVNSYTKKDFNKTNEIFKNLFTTYNIKPKLFDIYMYNKSYTEAEKCVDKNRAQIGRPQTNGLVRCYRSIINQDIRYDWIIRTRTDVYISFVLSSLPQPYIMNNYVVVGFVGAPTCGSPVAKWIDDKFALLPYGKAQKAYMLKYAQDFCKQPRCSGPTCQAPECKIGWTLGSRGLKTLDLRLIGRMYNVSTYMSIIRKNCNETNNAWTNCWKNKPLHVNSTSIEALMLGNFSRFVKGHKFPMNMNKITLNN